MQSKEKPEAQSMLMELTQSKMFLLCREGALNVASYWERLCITDMSITATHQQVSLTLAAPIVKSLICCGR